MTPFHVFLALYTDFHFVFFFMFKLGMNVPFFFHLIRIINIAKSFGVGKRNYAKNKV